jgi:2-polyprenyl-6-methoxyphenol hydroxylase-like FAD-dependent oxidoreductase
VPTLFASYLRVYEPLRAVVEATEDAAINRIDICDRDPVDRWGEGRVTLIGDAVHPPTPFLGQGACMALEDALVVARLLAATDDIPSALRSFAAQRKARTAWIQGFARRMGAWYHAPSMLARYGRDISMVVMPDVMLNKQMEKVINYEA